MLRYSAKNCSWFLQLPINSVCIRCWNIVLNCKTDKTPWTYMEYRPSLTEHEAYSAYCDGQQTSFCLQRAKLYGLENSSPLGWHVVSMDEQLTVFWRHCDSSKHCKLLVRHSVTSQNTWVFSSTAVVTSHLAWLETDNVSSANGTD